MVNYNNISDAFVEFWQRAGKSSLMKASGNSMYPLIKDGSIVTVAHINPQDIRVGDIGVFKSADRLCVHRIIEIRNINGNPSFVEKGDNSLFANVIHADKFIGKVTSIKNGEKVINLESSYWKIISSALGIYWFLASSFYKSAVTLKNSLHIKSNFLTSGISRLFFILSKSIPMLLFKLLSLASSSKK